MTKTQDSLQRIHEAVARLRTSTPNAELTPVIEAMQLIADHLDAMEPKVSAAAIEGDFYPKHEPPEYAGK